MNPAYFQRVNAVETPSLKRLRIIAIVLLFIIGLNALAAGYSFMAEPSGKDIGISTDYLKSSPFKNFFIPGLILFVVNGVLSIIAAICAIRKTKAYPQLIFLQGFILGGWILVQIIMVRDFNWMHFVCLLSALAFLFIGKKLSAA
jgi:hypothetical protein